MQNRYAVEYNMQHKNRGTAIIFNHMEFDARLNLNPRDGTEVDCARLQSVLKQLHFDVYSYDDLCHKKIVETVAKLASQNHEDSDCILIAILSHGEKGLINARDVQYKLQDICELLLPSKCPSLAGKPKLFIVQACQGDSTDPGVRLIATESLSSNNYTIPMHADFLIAQATIQGFVSWRNTKFGSCFIQNLCTELEEKSKDCDLLTLLTFVCRRVAVDFEGCTSEKQIPSITTMLTRNLFFRDGP
ncbi:caspase-like [Drosophila albomicans]|uniref:Caspase-like n=1 Tax=Drosophila albomicans TaxID=7291 RepID=A0A6P8XQ22_DROAB|nr:caspase-like [Drosophila albomicans]